ncbi:50S ribosomal protein L3 [Candidatus Magnetobacterium casense]|uniref:50S ribosomal protein L3 n=1 Tax=Candidatus Magnetobacterium casense TaxID=1455061 RepID=UPI0005910F42|nr:50S ribosomal protein L3 [Candidatus Magnetobacterium casensis]
MTGIIGKKLGMTQVFAENGNMVTVTLIEAGPCSVIQVKTIERDGYAAVKMGFIEERKVSKVNKPMKGVFDKANQKPYKILKEFKMTGLKVGDVVTVDKFAPGEKVKVSGISKGKGFQGVMKRHNYAGGPATHGSMFNRAPGSIGASSFPSRVWKNKGMPGHMGCERVSVKNVTIFDVKPDQNLLIVKGMVPGATGNIIEITRQN